MKTPQSDLERLIDAADGANTPMITLCTADEGVASCLRWTGTPRVLETFDQLQYEECGYRKNWRAYERSIQLSST
jgi:hypothetical protein